MKSEMELFAWVLLTILLQNLFAVHSVDSVQDIATVLNAMDEIEPSQTVHRSKTKDTREIRSERTEVFGVTAEVGKLFEFNASKQLGIQSNITSLKVSVHALHLHHFSNVQPLCHLTNSQYTLPVADPGFSVRGGTEPLGALTSNVDAFRQKCV